MGVFDGIPGYEEHILDAGKEPLFLLLVSFLITFALTRLYTRLARVYGLGSASAGGVHLHHYVVGIFLMFSAGLAMFALQPGRVATGVLAIFFGGGAAVTLDEFALWFHLKDVYWSEEGRSSIDATVLALLVGGLILVGASPLGTGEDYDSLLGLSAYRRFPLLLGGHHAAEREAAVRGGGFLPAGSRPRRRYPTRQADLAVGEVVLPKR